MTTKIKSGVISDNAITSAHISSGAISSAHLTSIDTDNITEGSSNLYFTTARVDSHLSGGTGVTYSSGAISIGQSVATSASPTFANLTVSNDLAVSGDLNLTGDLNITGDVNSLSVTDLDVTDQTITLGAGQVESASGGSGIVVDGSGASILWDETNDEWDFNKAVNINGGAEAYNFSATNSITIDNSSGYGAMELGGTSGAYVDLKNPSSDDYDLRLITFGSGGQIITASGSDLLLASSGNSNQLYLDSSGNVGIGEGSPANLLHVKASDVGLAPIDTALMVLEKSGTNYLSFMGANTNVQGVLFGDADDNDVGQLIYNHSSNHMAFSTAASTAMTIDSSGNVGIGVTPASWDGSMTALQLDTGSIYVNSVGSTYIAANFYYDTTSNTNKYIESNYAAALGLSNGRHEFYVAASGTAGNDVSFTEAMRIHSNGKVGIGSDVVSGPVMGLHVGNGTGVLFGPSGSSGSTYISPDHENTINGNYGMDTDAADLWVNYRGYQNGTSRFRNFKVGQGKEDLIAVFEGSSSNVGIGIPNGTSPTAKLHVGGAIKGTDLIAHDSDGLAFQTDEGTKRISILDSGAVVVGDNSLIGTNPTGSALNIFGDGVTLRLDGSGNSTKTILFRGTTAGNPGEIYADGGLRLRTEDAGMPITFYTNSTGTNNERMRIDGNDGSVRFKVGAGDTGDSTTNTGSVSMSNTDIDADTTYTHKAGRYLTSNGTGWETGSDGKNAALVIHNDNSQTDNRNWPGIIMHNENNTTSAYGPFIGWGARSPSGQYNTTYAWITGRPTGNGNDTNWRAGELELYTQHPGGYVGQKPGIRITSDGLVQQPKLYDSNGFFWVRNPNQSNQSATTGVIFETRIQAGSGNYSTSTGRYTTPVDGVYQFNAQVRIDGADASSSGHYMRMAFYTGTSPSAIQNSMSQGHVIHGPGMISGNYFSMSSSWAVYLSANTQVGVAVLANTGTYEIHQESNFSGFLVG